MSYCDQKTITDKAFTNLKNLHTLDIRCCNKKTITNKTFENFKNIHTLYVR